MKWVEKKLDGFSIFTADNGRLTLEPEDLDFDEWSLWNGTGHVMDGTRAECEAAAAALTEGK